MKEALAEEVARRLNELGLKCPQSDEHPLVSMVEHWVRLGGQLVVRDHPGRKIVEWHFSME